MKRVDWLRVAISIAFLLLVLSGCASSGNTTGNKSTIYGDFRGIVYQPQVRPEISSRQVAIANLRELLSGSNKRVPGVIVSGIPGTGSDRRQSFIELRQGAASPASVHYNLAGKPVYVIYSSINVFDDKIQASEKISLKYGDIVGEAIAVEHRPAAEVKAPTISFLPELGPRPSDSDLRPFVVGFPLNNIYFYFETLRDAAPFVDNLYFLQQELQKADKGRMDEFEALAAQYRESASKPIVSEEQRRYVVQANAMTNEKEYEQAVELYLKAIEIDPVAYPGAYFNLALLTAQLKNYPRAISYMKKYLLLVPDAQDARSAQDKIYEWEVIPRK